MARSEISDVDLRGATLVTGLPHRVVIWEIHYLYNVSCPPNDDVYKGTAKSADSDGRAPGYVSTLSECGQTHEKLEDA